MEHRSECCNTGYVNTCDVLVWFGIRIAFVGVTIWRAGRDLEYGDTAG